MRFKVEVCVDSYASAEVAAAAGVDRIELCSSLLEGGLTPSFGLVMQILKNFDIEIHVMLRPRSGDFLYSNEEFEIIKNDLKKLKEMGVNGFVIGILNPDGSVDSRKIHDIVELAKPLPITFHRAIDVCNDPIGAVDELVMAGVSRILTSGGQPSALLGKNKINQMVHVANGRLQIMAGAGVNDQNVVDLVESTNVKDIHFSASQWVDSSMTFRNKTLKIGDDQSDYGNRVASFESIRNMMETLQELDSNH